MGGVTCRMKLLSIARRPGRGQGDSRPAPRLFPKGTSVGPGTFSLQGRVCVQSATFRPLTLRSHRQWLGSHLTDLEHRSRPVHGGWIRNTVLLPSSRPENIVGGQRLFVEKGYWTFHLGSQTHQEQRELVEIRGVSPQDKW